MGGSALQHPQQTLSSPRYAWLDRVDTLEYQVELACERHFPRSFSFICGVRVHGCILFLISTTETFCPLKEYPLSISHSLVHPYHKE